MFAKNPRTQPADGAGKNSKGISIPKVPGALVNALRAAVMGAALLCVEGCATENNKSKSAVESSYGTQEFALTKEEVKNLKTAEKVEFSVPGIDQINFSTVNGKDYATYVADGSFYYVELTDTGAPANPLMAKKLALPTGPILDQIIESAIFVDKKIIYSPIGGGGGIADLQIDQTTGEILGVQNSQDYPIAATQVTIINQSGINYLLYDAGNHPVTGEPTVIKLNLQDDSEVITKVLASGGLPTYDDASGVWVGVYKAGSLWRIASSSTLEDTQTAQKQPAVGLLPGKSLENPRFRKLSTGEYIYFTVSEPDPNNPGKFLPAELYRSKLETPVVNPDPNPDVDAGSADGSDTTDTTDTTDSTDVPETTEPAETTDGAETTDTPDTTDSTDVPETTEAPDVETADTAETETPDNGNPEDIKDVGPDDTADGSTDDASKPDTAKPDAETTPDAEVKLDTKEDVTEQFKDLEIAFGDCKLEVTKVKVGKAEGDQVDISGFGECEAEVKVAGFDTPATIFMENKGGKIDVSCVFFPEQKPVCEVGLDTSAEVVEEGHGVQLGAHGSVTGSAASRFLVTPRAEGVFEAASYNKPEEPSVIVTFSDGSKAEIPSGGQVYRVDTKNGTVEPMKTLPDCKDSDTCESIDIKPGSFDAKGSDTTPNPPGEDGGCNTGKGKSSPAGLALGLLALAMIARFRKRTVKAE